MSSRRIRVTLFEGNNVKVLLTPLSEISCRKTFGAYTSNLGKMVMRAESLPGQPRSSMTWSVYTVFCIDMATGAGQEVQERPSGGCHRKLVRAKFALASSVNESQTRSSRSPPMDSSTGVGSMSCTDIGKRQPRESATATVYIPAPRLSKVAWACAGPSFRLKLICPEPPSTSCT